MKFSEHCKLILENDPAVTPVTSSSEGKGNVWKLEKKEEAQPGMIAYVKKGSIRPKILLGKIIKVYSKGIEYSSQGTYMAEWNDIIDIFDFKDKGVSKDPELTLRLIKEKFPDVMVSK